MGEGRGGEEAGQETGRILMLWVLTKQLESFVGTRLRKALCWCLFLPLALTHQLISKKNHWNVKQLLGRLAVSPFILRSNVSAVPGAPASPQNRIPSLGFLVFHTHDDTVF